MDFIPPHLAFATPIIITGNMDDSDFQQEYEKMKIRADATDLFINGELSDSDFLDAMHYGGVDVYQVTDLWERGIKLMA